jgi:mono/diheme cytochrome c family protein
MKLQHVFVVVTIAAAVGASRLQLHAGDMAASGQSATGGEPGPSVWDGVYTEAQAGRGEIIYAQSCAVCHGVDLSGGEMAPGLSTDEFKWNWNGVPVSDLADRIRISMPEDDPGSLSRQETSDVLAFMLWRANYPPGTTELARQAEFLRGIMFLAVKPER